MMKLIPHPVISFKHFHYDTPSINLCQALSRVLHGSTGSDGLKELGHPNSAVCLLQEPAMVAWLKIKDRKVREAAPVTADIDAQISHFMFHHYCHWFSKDDVGEAFAIIPQV